MVKTRMDNLNEIVRTFETNTYLNGNLNGSEKLRMEWAQNG